MKIHYFERARRKLCIAKLTDCPEDNPMESIAIFEKGGEMYAVQSYEKEAIDDDRIIEKGEMTEIESENQSKDVYLWGNRHHIVGKQTVVFPNETVLDAPYNLWVMRNIPQGSSGVGFGWINVLDSNDRVRQWDIICIRNAWRDCPDILKVNLQRMPIAHHAGQIDAEYRVD